MNTDAIDEAFASLISGRAIHKKLGETSNNIKQLRFKLKNGVNISTDLKLKLLQKSGWAQPQDNYTRAQLVDLLKFYKRSSQATKDLGFEYVIDKWENKK